MSYIETIKKQTNITDENIIKEKYKECNQNELDTILKLLKLDKNKSNIDTPIVNSELEEFKKIMFLKENFFYNKFNTEQVTSD